MTPPWLRAVPGGVEIEVLAVPRASRSKVVGEHGGRLKVQLAAPPVEGEANRALVELLAELCGVPRRGVTLVHGEAGRRKTVRVAGVSAEAAARALQRML